MVRDVSSEDGLPNSNQPSEAGISQLETSPVSSPAGGVGDLDRRTIPATAFESIWRARDGAAIRRIDWQAPNADCRGSLLFMPGRGDFYEKYLETLDYWYKKGLHVTAADWRGQSGSGRLGSDAVTGHIGDFADWVEDLSDFWREWRATTPGPHVLVGHSMGGHLVLRAVAEKKVDPAAVVLSAPMLGLLTKGTPLSVMQPIARMIAALGDRRRPAWKWSEKPGAIPADRIALLTHDQDRYEDELWWRDSRPALVMGPASWGWVERSIASMRVIEQPGLLESVSTPFLIVATSADRLVEFAAIERAARRLPRGELLAFGAEARHEILRESDAVRDVALAAIDRFLDRLLAAAI